MEVEILPDLLDSDEWVVRCDVAVVGRILTGGATTYIIPGRKSGGGPVGRLGRSGGVMVQ